MMIGNATILKLVIKNEIVAPPKVARNDETDKSLRGSDATKQSSFRAFIVRTVNNKLIRELLGGIRT